MVVTSADLKPPWPDAAYGPDFELYLDELSCWINKVPLQSTTTNILDYVEIEKDIQRHNKLIIENNMNLSATEILKLLLCEKQSQLTNTLTPESVKGFEAYKNFSVLQEIATSGVKAHLLPTF